MNKRIADWMAGQDSEPGDGNWSDPAVRGALLAMHGFACAYCQHALPYDHPGDVEHFRPKSIYPWLKYAYDNYFLSCNTCNSGRKRTEFPLARGVPASYPARDRLPDEERLLLDPCLDPVDSVVKVDTDDLTFPARAVRGAGQPYERRAEATVGFFEFDSLVYRKPRKNSLLAALRRLNSVDQGDESEQLELRKSASRYQPHGQAIRDLVGKYRPDLLPGADEELTWFVAELLEDFAAIRQDIATARPELVQIYTRLGQRLCYALAVLWKYPPALSSEAIRDMVERAGALASVEILHQKI